MPGEKSKNILGELGGEGDSPPLISSDEEDKQPNQAARASSTSSPSVAAKTKKQRNTKRLPGPRKTPKSNKHVKIRTDRCKKIRRFFGKQRSATGLPIENVLSQSLTRREVRLKFEFDLENSRHL